MTDERVSAGRYAPGEAPRVDKATILNLIVGEKYVRMPDGRTTICELTLLNGFTVRGESSCVFVENFDEDIGRSIAKEAAVGKVWQLEGYLLAQRHYEHALHYAGN